MSALPPIATEVFEHYAVFRVDRALRHRAASITFTLTSATVSRLGGSSATCAFLPKVIGRFFAQPLQNEAAADDLDDRENRLTVPLSPLTRAQAALGRTALRGPKDPSL